MAAKSTGMDMEKITSLSPYEYASTTNGIGEY